MKNKLIFLFVFVICSSLALAVCPEDPGCTWDVTDVASFDYSYGSYETITDWTVVDYSNTNFNWNNVPVTSIPNIPTDELDYADLNGEQRMQMSSSQIAGNFNNIENLATDVNSESAKAAIQETYGVVMKNFRDGAQIRDNVIKATFGEEGWVNLQKLSTGAGAEVDSEGNIKVTDSTTLPQEGTYTTNYQKDTLVQIGEQELLFGQGDLQVQEGKFVVKRGSQTVINGYTISSSTNDINIYFNNKPSAPENYFAIFDNSISMGSLPNNEVVIEVLPPPEFTTSYLLDGIDPKTTGYTNELLGMVLKKYNKDEARNLIPNDYGLVRDKSYLKVTLTNGNTLDITSRKDEGLTPLFEHHGNSITKIQSGLLNFQISNEGFKLASVEEPKWNVYDRNSVAFELVSDSTDHILRMTSSNRYAELDSSGLEVASSNIGLEVTNSWEINMIKTPDDLRVKYPKITFESFRDSVSADLNYPEKFEEYPTGSDESRYNAIQLVDQWLRDKPSIENYVTTIDINSFKTYGSLGKIGIYDLELLPSLFQKNSFRYMLSASAVLNHELGHVLDFHIQSQETTVDNSLLSMYNDYASKTVDELYSNPRLIAFFEKLEGEEGLIDYINNVIIPKHYPYTVPIDLHSTDPYVKANNLHSIDTSLKKIADEYPGVFEEQTLTNFNTEINDVIRDNTGLYAYSFFILLPEEGSAELLTTYGELPTELAQRSPGLAQLEYDRVMSLDPPAPDWLHQPAEERYWEIVGGPDSSYCQENDCGPCKAYTSELCNRGE